jgi:hypothetical protein
MDALKSNRPDPAARIKNRLEYGRNKHSRQRFKLKRGSEPMMILRPHAVALALFAAILPVGFALAQGGPATSGAPAVGPNGPAGIGAPAGAVGGVAPPPPITGQSAPLPPTAVQGIAEQAPGSTVGMSRPAPDGSTKIVPARPCSSAARETDGTTTCIGIPR